MISLSKILVVVATVVTLLAGAAGGVMFALREDHRASTSLALFMRNQGTDRLADPKDGADARQLQIKLDGPAIQRKAPRTRDLGDFPPQADHLRVC